MAIRCWSPMVEKAIRVSAAAHHGQFRKGSQLPYLLHPAAVALILVRAGFVDDDVIAAAILHDTLEDTDVTIDSLRAEFSPEVCEIVEGASEHKVDRDGRVRPWLDRKREHIERIRTAPLQVRAVVLADKLHNLQSIVVDLKELEPVWERFNASKADVLWYHGELIEAASCSQASIAPDVRLVNLAAECRGLIEELR